MRRVRRTGRWNRWLCLACAAVFLFGHHAVPAQLYQRPLTPQQLRAATQDTVEKDAWQEHLERLDRAVLEFARRSPALGGAPSYETLLKDDVMGQALAQTAFIRQVTPAPLERTADALETCAFLQWLLMNRGALEEFLESLRPQDDVVKVLKIWARLWTADPPGREKYASLALACALVFDQTVTLHPRPNASDSERPAAIDPLERYLNFRAAADKGQLRARPTDYAAWELVWAVDAPLPPSDIEWARKHVWLSPSRWSETYHSVPYNADRLLGTKDIYKDYSLPEIKKEGGICGDQAYFAAMTAKANGIPAMMIFGEGQRGGHVWFGYEASPGHWDFNGGRYELDRFATGYTRDPQTRQVVKEAALNLMGDPQRRLPDYRQASRLVWLAELFAAHNDTGRAGNALESAVTTSSRHMPAWTALLAHLKKTGAPSQQWNKVLTTLRDAFRNYPDVLAMADQWETEHTQSAKGTGVAARTMRQQYRKLEIRHDSRTDLILENVGKQVALLEKQGNLDGAERVLRIALTDKGREVVAFRELAAAYVAFAHRHNRQRDALRFICSKFAECLPEPHGDYFAMRAYASLSQVLADILEKDGQESKARRLRKDAERLEKSAHNLVTSGLE